MGRVLNKKIAVQVSDLHISKIGKRELKILGILNELNPDLIFLTGDYVQWKEGYEVSLFFLSQLKAKIGIWGVMGDYDYSNSRKSCIFCHEAGKGKPTRAHPVHFLNNTFEEINLPEGSLWIGGLDPWPGRALSLKKDFLQQAANRTAVVLSHNPLFFDLFDDNSNILMLAGDTHGGQIPLPLPSWLLKKLGYEKNARYNQGFFEEGSKRMYVSRGIGMSHVPVRLFRQPEIVVLHFMQE